MSQFSVDEANNDDEHFYVDIAGKGSVVIISNQDGVSVDIYKGGSVGNMEDADDPIFSGYVFNGDFDDEDDYAHCESCDRIINKDTETFIVYADDTFCAQCALKEM